MKNMLLITAGLLPVVGLAAPKATVPAKPNIVFFLMDDLGIGELGINGQKLIETPNLDALAKAGKMLTQHYSGSPVSAPSRCVLLTGLHTGHSTVRGNDEMAERGKVWSHEAMLADSSLEGQRPIPLTEQTIAKTLKEAGYATGCIGKWGLGYPGSTGDPKNAGFDFFYGYNCQRQSHTYYPTHLWRNGQREMLRNEVLQPNTKLKKGADSLDARNYDHFAQKDYAPDKMFDATIEFIEANANKNPFFLWWTTPLPHVSLQAPKELVAHYVKKFGDEAPFMGDGMYFPARYPHATYAAMVTLIDRQIGAIVDKLKSEGVYDNTIIVFTSDNGPTFNGGTDSPWFDSARPYKAERGWGKCSLHEGGINVPAFVTWNNVIESGSRSAHVSSFQDWFPTLVDFAGAKLPSDRDGISMYNLLVDKGKQKEHKAIYWEYPEGGGSIAVRKGDWKMIVSNIAKKKPVYQLFDLKTDYREQNDVSAKYPKIMAELLEFAAKSHTAPVNKSFDMGLPLQPIVAKTK